MVSAVGSPWGRTGWTLAGEALGAGHGRVQGGGGRSRCRRRIGRSGVFPDRGWVEDLEGGLRETYDYNA